MAATRLTGRSRRKQRVRKKVYGTAERPRLTVFRSLRHIYAQVINDNTGQTLAAASTLSKELREKVKTTGNTEAAKAVGELLAQTALDLSRCLKPLKRILELQLYRLPMMGRRHERMKFWRPIFIT